MEKLNNRWYDENNNSWNADHICNTCKLSKYCGDMDSERVSCNKFQPEDKFGYPLIIASNKVQPEPIEASAGGIKEYYTDEEIKQLAPYYGKSCNEHWIAGFKYGLLHRPMPSDDIKAEAIKVANGFQFKSNHIYDHKSVEDGFLKGWEYASQKVVLPEDDIEIEMDNRGIVLSWDRMIGRTMAKWAIERVKELNNSQSIKQE